MIHEVITANYIEGYKIELVFKDGKSGIVDFSEYPRRGGVFLKFASLEFFRDFWIGPESGTLTWRDEIDIAPETLYSKATNTPLPSWMQPDEDARQSA